MTQLILDLPPRTALGRPAFFPSPSNQAALAAIDAWQGWPQQRLVLAGPEGSGKTHLAGVFAELAGATILDAASLDADSLPQLVRGPLVLEDVDRGVPGNPVRERALFHLLNALSQARQSLLITARLAPSQWETGLPDLTSRLRAMALSELSPPDDALLSALLVKLFADRQIDIRADLIAYLVRRIERSARGAALTVERLDAAALAENTAVTVPLARRVLGT